MSRTRSSVVNFLTAVIGQIFGFLASFIARIVFVKILGSEYLGLNGLFTNILTVLSLAELGVGSAITYSLYEPLAKNDYEKCKSLMKLYKYIYLVIGTFIFVAGICISPFLLIFIKEMPNIDNLNIIFILFVVNTAISYFYSYKRNLIIADQNRYIATIYRYAFYFALNVAQIVFLIITKNYFVYLILQIISNFLENYFISKKADKMYPFLSDKNVEKLDKESINDIKKNTKAMMMHKIGGTVVSSTDNIILSKFVGLEAVGLYSNYYMVIYALNLFFTQLYNSLTPSVGNLWATSTTNKRVDIFKKIDFLTFWVYSFSSICLLYLFNSFIKIWVGKEYLFDFNVVLILTINFYITGMRKSVLTFRDATGLFYRDRWKSIVEALINLVVSIVLAINFGTFGVFLGTFISSITTSVWVEPFILFKDGFKIKTSLYFKTYFKRLMITIIICIITFIPIKFIVVSNIYLSFIVKLIICLLLPNLILYIMYRNSDEFKYFYDKFGSIINYISGKIKKIN
jgi:O-antigen/teichoic acid export membrane protein